MFTGGYTGLISMDTAGAHQEAYDTFSAKWRKDADGMSEVEYAFAIWKDNAYVPKWMTRGPAVGVLVRVAELLAAGLKDASDCGTAHADLAVFLTSELGHGEPSTYDVTRLVFGKEVELYDAEGVPEPPVRDGWSDFTDELRQVHSIAEPDAWGPQDNNAHGGVGTSVRILGLKSASHLNGKAGKIVQPVDLVSGRWAVKVGHNPRDGIAPVLVKRQNLEIFKAGKENNVAKDSTSISVGSNEELQEAMERIRGAPKGTNFVVKVAKGTYTSGTCLSIPADRVSRFEGAGMERKSSVVKSERKGEWTILDMPVEVTDLHV